MGRPLNKRFFGDPSGAGNQLRVDAFIPGGGGVVTAWIVNQKSNTTYTVTDGTDTGRCKLQAAVPTVAGQMRVSVSPFGFDIATGTVDMQLESVNSVGAGGSGYSVADTLTLAGGTSTVVATVDVDTIGTVTGQDETFFDNSPTTEGTFTPGASYAALDTITLSDGTIVTVDAVSGGAVTQFTVTTASTSGTASDGATLTQSSTSGGGTGFELILDTDNQAVFAASPLATGDYSITPANPVSTTGGTGSGATLIVDWEVKDVNVAAGGSGYLAAPTVTFVGGEPGVAATATAILTDDAVTSVTVDTAGDDYSNQPTVTFGAPAGDVEYARILNAHQVKTFSGNVYSWDAIAAADSVDKADLDFA